MPKAFRNPRTGLLRRQQPRYTSRNRRSHAAYSHDIVDAKTLQNEIIQQETMVTFGLAISIFALLKRAEMDDNDLEVDDADAERFFAFAFSCVAMYRLLVPDGCHS